MALNRTKLLTSASYSADNPANPRSDVDGSIQEIADLLALTTDGASGADGVGATVIPALGAANTVQSQMEASVAYSKALVDGFVMGAIPDNSIEDKKLKETVYAPIPVTIGNNTVTVANKTDVIPRIDFTPISYVNDFGKVGNCEATTGFTVSGCTIALDTVNKVFGANCIAITLTATTGTVTIPLPSVFDVSAYHLFSAYLKKGTATNIKFEKDATNGGVSKSVTSTDSTMTRNAFKAIPSDNNAGNLLKITVTGSIGNVAYIDGLMSNAITLAENSDSEAVLMARYPYGDSVVPTINPTLDITHADGSKTKTVLEGEFLTGDVLSVEGGQVTGSKLWKKKTLYGKDFPWQYRADFTGYKLINIVNAENTIPSSTYGHLKIVVKSDGKMIPVLADIIASDQAYFDPTNYIISIADTDSGWAEFVNPNDDEVKAFMNGWKAIANNGTRYIAWININDFTAPAGSRNSDLTAQVNSSQGVINVVDGTKFTNGDSVVFVSTTGTYIDQKTVLSVSGNTVTMTSNFIVNVASGTHAIVADVPATSTPMLNYCKTNVAPNYEGYKLYYKLATAQPIGNGSDDYLVPLKGDVPVLEAGNNTVNYDTGIVRGEIITPLVNIYDSSQYWANVLFMPTTKFKNKTENVLVVYKNGIVDPSWSFVGTTSAYGYVAPMCLAVNFDPTATYTVDYTILRTNAPQISTAQLSFKEGITDAINRIADALTAKQNQHKVLDDFIDASLFEKIPSRIFPTTWFAISGILYVRIHVLCKSKIVPPLIKNDGVFISKGSSAGMVGVTEKFQLTGYSFTDGQLVVTYKTTDSTTITDIKSYGVTVSGGFTLDSRGVI